MSRCKWLVLVLVCAGLSGAAPAEAPLAWRFRAKDRFWAEVKKHEVTRTKQNGQAREVTVDCADVCRFTVLEVKPDGGAVLEVHIERVEYTGAGAAPDLMTRMMQGATARVTLAADMKVTAVDGLEPLVTMLVGKEESPARRQVRAAAEAQVSALLANVFHPLPNKAVRPGATWQTREETAAQATLGRGVKTTTFTARGVTAADGRPVRKIGVRAKARLGPAGPPAAGPLMQNVKSELKEFDEHGTLLYDPAAGRLLSGERRMQVKLACSFTQLGQQVESESETTDVRTLKFFDHDPLARPEPAAAKAKGPPPKSLKNSLGMKLVLVPAGKFTMGSPNTEQGRLADEEQHEVEITQAFYMAAHEVTIGQFRQFVEATGYKTSAETNAFGGIGLNEATGKVGPGKEFSWKHPGWKVTDDHPATNLSWNDARAFCSWLAQKEGKPYRLPTEAEWEYACRAGTATRYHHGDDPEGLLRTGNVADASTHTLFPQWTTIAGDDGAVFTAPVGKREPNAWGLYDMHGNAAEWCEDWYWRYNPEARRDPTGPPAGLKHVTRGGCWADFPLQCSAARRSSLPPEGYTPGTGLRVVLPADGR